MNRFAEYASRITRAVIAGLAVLLLIACVASSLTGCSVIQAKIDADVQAVTVPDLQAAISDAQAANDQDGLDCWTEVLNYIEALPTTAANTTPKIAGIASAIEAGRIAAQTPTQVMPPVPHSLHKACAVLQIDAQQLAVKFGIQAAALTKGVGIAKAGAALQGQAAALKAAEAAMAVGKP